MGAVLQLDRFDRDLAPPRPEAPADPEAARAEAFAAGEAAGRAAAGQSLADALRALHSQQAEAEGCAAAALTAMLRHASGILAGVFDGVVPTATRLRLEAALMSEIPRLAAPAPAPALRLRCDPDMAVLAQACADREGVPLQVDPGALPGQVELIPPGGGRITFDQAAIAAQLRALLSEILDRE